MLSKIENPKNLLAAAWRNFGFSSMGVCCGFANSHGGATVETRGMVNEFEDFLSGAAPVLINRQLCSSSKILTCVKAKSSKFLWEHLRKPISLILNLLYDAGYIVLRMPLCGFQKIKNFISVDSLFLAGVHINDAVCLRVFRNRGVVGNEKEVIFQEVVTVSTRDIFHIHDALGGQISEALVVPAVHIPFR